MMKRKVINSFFEVMNQCLVIRVTEDLDHHRVMSLREEADSLIEKERIQNIVFDFDGVTFMDSSGIGFVLGRYRIVESYGGNVEVVNLSGRLYSMMKLAGLEKLVNLKRKKDVK